MKVYQVPCVFQKSSEDEYTDEESSFIVIFYEKSMRKRTYVKSTTQKQRMARLEDIKSVCKPMVLEELMPNRDSKMRRFCNYFLTLFNQSKLNPFTQFVNSKTLKEVKQNVRLKMQYFTMGVSENEAKKKDKKGQKRKNETKAQKVPAAMKVNSMGQHGISADANSVEKSPEKINQDTSSGPNEISNPDVSIDIKKKNSNIM